MEGRSEYKKGFWSAEEDRILMDYVRVHGKGNWNRVAKVTGLKRCGKSCRLRWINYLSPSVKRGDFSEEEDDLIIRLHNLLGNRWSLIAGRVPGRTDNQVKNHWNTHLSKKLGVKKGKCKVSRPHSWFSKELGANFHNPSSSSLNNATPLSCNDGAVDQNVMENYPKNAAEINNTAQELMMSDCYKDSFWFSYDEPYIPNLMEQLNESHDFFWNVF